MLDSQGRTEMNATEGEVQNSFIKVRNKTHKQTPQTNKTNPTNHTFVEKQGVSAREKLNAALFIPSSLKLETKPTPQTIHL